MTFADQLREQGYQRGRQEGVQQGISGSDIYYNRIR